MDLGVSTALQFCAAGILLGTQHSFPGWCPLCITYEFVFEEGDEIPSAALNISLFVDVIEAHFR